MRIAICGAAAAMMFVLSPAYAQNKCVDANGKVTYQTDPCPAAARAPAPARPAAPAGPSLKQLSADYAQMERCAADSAAQAATSRRNREELERRKREGQDTARDEVIEQQRLQLVISSFPPVCAQYGFEASRDEQAAQRNAAAATSLQPRMRTLRSEIETAKQREIGLAAARDNEKSAARVRGTRDANDDWRQRQECTRSQLQIDEARQQLSQYPSEYADQQARYLSQQQQRLNEVCNR
jgi:hypothetical protein